MRSWLRGLADDVSAQRGNHANDLIQAGWRLGEFFRAYGHINGLPFRRFEDHFAIEVRAFATESAQVEYFPGHDRVHRQAIVEPAHSFEVTGFDTTSGFQRAKIDFSMPIIIPPKIILSSS